MDHGSRLDLNVPLINTGSLKHNLPQLGRRVLYRRVIIAPLELEGAKLPLYKVAA